MNRAALAFLAVLAVACQPPSYTTTLHHPDGRTVRCSTDHRIGVAGAIADSAYRQCISNARMHGFVKPGEAAGNREWYQVDVKPCLIYETAKPCESAAKSVGGTCKLRTGPRPKCPGG